MKITEYGIDLNATIMYNTCNQMCGCDIKRCSKERKNDKKKIRNHKKIYKKNPILIFKSIFTWIPTFDALSSDSVLADMGHFTVWTRVLKKTKRNRLNCDMLIKFDTGLKGMTYPDVLR